MVPTRDSEPTQCAADSPLRFATSWQVAQQFAAQPALGRGPAGQDEHARRFATASGAGWQRRVPARSRSIQFRAVKTTPSVRRGVIMIIQSASKCTARTSRRTRSRSPSLPAEYDGGGSAGRGSRGAAIEHVVNRQRRVHHRGRGQRACRRRRRHCRVCIRWWHGSPTLCTRVQGRN